MNRILKDMCTRGYASAIYRLDWSILMCTLLLGSWLYGLRLCTATVQTGIFWIEENLAKGSMVGQLSSTYGRDSMELRSVVYTNLAQDVVAQYFRVDATDGTVYAAERIDREALCDDRVPDRSDPGNDYVIRRARVPGTRGPSTDRQKSGFIPKQRNISMGNESSPSYKSDQLRSQRAADIFSGSHQTASITCRVKFQVHVGLTMADGTSDSILQDVQIMIADVNDNKPTFPSEVYVLQILESSPIDAEFRLPLAHDPDSGMHGITVYKIDRLQLGHENIPGESSVCHVTSSIEANLNPEGKIQPNKLIEYPFAGDYFVLHAQRLLNGRLQPQLKQIRQLDREHTSNLYLCLVAQDGGGNQGYLFVRIELMDANDNVPQWRGLPYKVTLSECDPSTEYGTNGVGLEGHRIIGTYLASSNVADPTLRHVITLHADDPDLGSNGQCTFRLGQQANSDRLRASSRVQLPNLLIKENKVFLTSKLDHETLPHFFIPVEVVDGGGLVNYTEIEVTVNDCNDHAPTITVIPLNPPKLGQNRNRTKAPFPGASPVTLPATLFPTDAVLWLEEEYKPRVDLATIMAQDRDKMDAGRVTCRLEHHKLAPTQASYFDLIPLDGGSLVSLTPGLGAIKQAISMFTLYKREGLKVDREKTASIVLSVLCTDNGAIRGHETRKLIYVHILDINDNPPKITPFDYSLQHHDRSAPYVTQTLTVPENQPFGTLIGTIRATDPDEGPNAQLTYSFLLPPYPSNWTGLSDMPVGQTITELFELERTTGKLFTHVPLDRETNASYVAYVKVMDNGVPSLTSIVRLNILVSDMNDNPPRFVVTEGASGRIVFHTTESDGERPVHGRLIGQLITHDEDFGRNQTVHFSMVEDSVSPSGLPVTYRVTNEGKIYVDGVLDREQCAQHQLTVRAVDGGPVGHQLTASAVVIVQLDDVNDSPPQFVQPPTMSNNGIPSELINITVKMPPGSVIYRVQATDMDQPANTKLNFVLRSAKFLSNYFTLRPTESTSIKSGGFSEASADLILVNPLTELPAVQLTNPEAMYSAPKEYFIYIIVKDNDSEPSHSATARLRIHVYPDRPLMNRHQPTSFGSVTGPNTNNQTHDSLTTGHVMGLTKQQQKQQRSNSDTADFADPKDDHLKADSSSHTSYRYHKNTSITVILILAIVIICVFLGIFCFVAFLYLRGAQRRGGSGASPAGSASNPRKRPMNGTGSGHGFPDGPSPPPPLPPPNSEDVEQMAYWELLNQNCELGALTADIIVPVWGISF
ncbi:unnamed protein product [Echinostoma caproni]|uniref:Cadherin domain-containing protein n=1 Tax=Echinostoma caproni TaxID=27848 RepID=A0A183A758_9TREM|nr:unnamed protein product [Echinostoma caproni]